MLKFLAKRLAPAALLFAFLAAAAVGPAPFTASASSHREAPLISNDPQADNTGPGSLASGLQAYPAR